MISPILMVCCAEALKAVSETAREAAMREVHAAREVMRVAPWYLSVPGGGAKCESYRVFGFCGAGLSFGVGWFWVCAGIRVMLLVR
ncbi:hypothetical protein PCAR4_440134 [Paraburkholderia caribensis]|nr:hypothetical protein PCAR4_440134 [Paraburkholderia caribensis]